ncbi:MAG: hypothetical protein J0L97_01135 [Alphaproteobacteria bacterium]|nr:hypothetical protein [Alphaproteobacteria bacterium]
MKKTIKIVLIVVAVLVLLLVLLFGGGIFALYKYSDDIARAVSDKGVEQAEKEILPRFKTVEADPPLTNQQRDQITEAAEKLIAEIKTASGELEISREKAEAAEKNLLKIAADFKLVGSLGKIAEDGRLNQEEYGAWVKYYQVRDKETSPEKTAFESFFQIDTSGEQPREE